MAKEKKRLYFSGRLRLAEDFHKWRKRAIPNSRSVVADTPESFLVFLFEKVPSIEDAVAEYAMSLKRGEVKG